VIRGLALTVGLLLIAAACSTSEDSSPASGAGTGAPARWQTRVVATYPHDPEAFTQGLVWAGEGELFESTGRRGSSSLRLVEVATGEVRRRHDLEPQYFGEGLALVDDELVQLTWQEDIAFRYDAATFEPTGTFSYDTEGWGLCHDGEQLVMSDGSATLTKRDPSSFAVTESVAVTLDGAPLDELNELECVDESVYANVLGDDNIYRIDPTSGRVDAVIDASDLEPLVDRSGGKVLNGIAFDPESEHFFVTGKNWRTLYEVTFEPIDPAGE
jgi:glutamine cyclotransferase